MYLTLAGGLPTTLFDLTELNHLQLIRCTNINAFLRTLESLGLSLSSVWIENYDKMERYESAVNDFIRSLRTLKRCTLLSTHLSVLDETPLRQHASSLESLRIEGLDDYDPPILPTCWSTPNLEQLAISGMWVDNVERISYCPRHTKGKVERIPLRVSIQLSDLRLLSFTLTC
jgi:hypothetical protein